MACNQDPRLCAALSTKPRCKSLKTAHLYIVSFLKRLSNFLKQLSIVVFNQMLLKQEEMVHLLSTIFSYRYKYLLVGYIHCWFESIHGICWENGKYRILPALPFTRTCESYLLPSSIAWQSSTHIEWTIQAVEELSTPPLKGNRKPAWHTNQNHHKNQSEFQKSKSNYFLISVIVQPNNLAACVFLLTCPLLLR